MNLSKEQQDLWILVQKLNQCWYKEKSSGLLDFFHPDVVFNSPDFKHQITGKETCVQSYIDFTNNSKVILYNESNPTVALYANTSIVTYDFEMKYEQKNKTYHETGTDILVCERYQDLWKVIWRGLGSFKNV